LAELTQLREQHAATDVLRKTIAVLERQLANARTELRQMTTSKSAQQKSDAEAPSHAGPKPAAIRAWARENGYEVGGGGLIPKAIVQAYERAHAAGERASS
jgi:hypothetical protein